MSPSCRYSHTLATEQTQILIILIWYLTFGLYYKLLDSLYIFLPVFNRVLLTDTSVKLEPPVHRPVLNMRDPAVLLPAHQRVKEPHVNNQTALRQVSRRQKPLPTASTSYPHPLRRTKTETNAKRSNRHGGKWQRWRWQGGEVGQDKKMGCWGSTPGYQQFRLPNWLRGWWEEWRRRDPKEGLLKDERFRAHRLGKLNLATRFLSGERVPAPASALLEAPVADTQPYSPPVGTNANHRLPTPALAAILDLLFFIPPLVRDRLPASGFLARPRPRDSLLPTVAHNIFYSLWALCQPNSKEFNFQGNYVNLRGVWDGFLVLVSLLCLRQVEDAKVPATLATNRLALTEMLNIFWQIGNWYKFGPCIDKILRKVGYTIVTSVSLLFFVSFFVVFFSIGRTHNAKVTSWINTLIP